MSLSEAAGWAKLDAIMGESWAADRIENRFNPGFPDVFYSIDGVSGVMELKLLIRNKRGLWRVSDVRASQVRWFKRHARHTTRAHLLALFMKEQALCGCVFRACCVPSLVHADFVHADFVHDELSTTSHCVLLEPITARSLREALLPPG